MVGVSKPGTNKVNSKKNLISHRMACLRKCHVTWIGFKSMPYEA